MGRGRVNGPCPNQLSSRCSRPELSFHPSTRSPVRVHWILLQRNVHPTTVLYSAVKRFDHRVALCPHAGERCDAPDKKAISFTYVHLGPVHSHSCGCQFLCEIHGKVAKSDTEPVGTKFHVKPMDYSFGRLEGSSQGFSGPS